MESPAEVILRAGLTAALNLGDEDGRKLFRLIGENPAAFVAQVEAAIADRDPLEELAEEIGLNEPDFLDELAKEIGA